MHMPFCKWTAPSLPFSYGFLLTQESGPHRRAAPSIALSYAGTGTAPAWGASRVPLAKHCRQGQGRRRGQKLFPLGGAVDGTVFVRIDFAPGPIPTVPLSVAGLRCGLHHDIVADAELLQVHALIAALHRGPRRKGQGDLLAAGLR